MTQTRDGVPFTKQQQDDWDWENYRNDRIDRLASEGKLPTNPYEW